jgi:hypothetical protein
MMRSQALMTGVALKRAPHPIPQASGSCTLFYPRALECSHLSPALKEWQPGLLRTSAEARSAGIVKKKEKSFCPATPEGNFPPSLQRREDVPRACREASGPCSSACSALGKCLLNCGLLQVERNGETSKSWSEKRLLGFASLPKRGAIRRDFIRGMLQPAPMVAAGVAVASNE